jgi:hypothetical protein
MQNRIDYNEFSRFQTSEHKTFQYRPEQPDWLNSEEKLRKVLAQLVWNLARPGQNAGRVPDVLVDDLATLRLVADVAFLNWCRNKPTREVENFARAVLRAKGILQLFSLILWGYRMGLSSPEISEQTGMSPVCIRQRLFRIRKIARKLFDSTPVDRPRKPKCVPKKKRIFKGTYGNARTFDWNAAKRLRERGMTHKAIGLALGVHKRTIAAALRKMKEAA